MIFVYNLNRIIGLVVEFESVLYILSRSLRTNVLFTNILSF